MEARMKAVVNGEETPLEHISQFTDWSSVKKVSGPCLSASPPTLMVLQYHKLNDEPAIKAASKDTQAEHALVDDFVVSGVAMKSVLQ
jgi:hypothetical protein